ncbi:MAG TPA: MraY family glycosyltransferase [Sedimentisphaerales bacterium]|nr:MraY family glycosyltransferase [Sedimentisphaerales bacterium]
MFGNFIGQQHSLGWIVDFWPVFAVSLVVGLAATALCKKVALKLGIVDKPDNLVKTHKAPVAYMGGIGILAGLLSGMMAGAYLMRDKPYFGEIFGQLLGIAAGGAVACIVGLIDDVVDMRPWQKITGQVAAAILLLAAGIRPRLHYFTDMVGISMSPEVEALLGIPVVLIFVLGATNSLNLLDGLDGLCGGVTAIITLAMFGLAVHLGTWGLSETGDAVRLIVCLACVGGVLGFLPFNRHPAKIFMGDAGSMLLGFVVASLMILFAEGIPRWWMASIVVFGLPILDTATAMVRRLVNRRPLFKSDRGHIYDQMIDRGIPLKKTVGICYALAGMYAVLGLFMSQIRTRYAMIAYVLISVVSALAIWRKGYLKMEGVRGAVRKEA